jgi:hypothetical protein
MPKLSYADLCNADVIAFPSSKEIKIPAGTYVKKVGPKEYKVNAWRGMPKEYKKYIDEGVTLTHSQVKGWFN